MSNTITFYPTEIKLQLKAILIAVSVLSPVKTHNLIPLSFINSIVLSTYSCNLSSIAVTPRMSSPFSISSYNYWMSSSSLLTLLTAD